jgi:hypothetical protein
MLGNKNEGWCMKSLAKPQGQGSMIAKDARSAFGWYKKHTDRLKSGMNMIMIVSDKV